MKQFFKAFCVSLLLSMNAFASTTTNNQCCSVSSVSGCCNTQSTSGTTTLANTCCASDCPSFSSCSAACSDSCSTGCSASCGNSCSNTCSNSCSDSCDTCCTTFPRTTTHFRSQGANTARELVGWQWDIYRPEMCLNYGAGYLAFEYQQSFRSNQLAKQLFGSSTLTFSGSQVANRAATDLLADNFGLSRKFVGSITFAPKIQNFIVDLGYFMALNEWCPGLYIRFHAPIVHTRWDLKAGCGNCCEVGIVESNAGIPFDPCYVGTTPNPAATPLATPGLLPVTTTVANPNTFAGAVLASSSAAGLMQALSGTFLFGDMQTPWSAGRFPFQRRSRTGLADIDVILGYNWYNEDCYHLGVYAQAVLPTGPKQRNLYVFDPVVGNGGFFELGAGLSAHAVLWSGQDSNVAFFLEGNVTHMFKREQCRLFDFCLNGAFSRYMLLKEFETNGQTRTYAGSLISATSFANRQVDVKVNVKGDASIKLAGRWCGWGIDLGYNIYGHSEEKIELKCNACPCDLDQRQFGIKGTESVCAFSYPIAEVGTGLVPTVFPAGVIFPAGAVAPIDCPTLPAVSTVEAAVNNGTQKYATAYAGAPRTCTTGTTAASTCFVTLSSDSADISAATPVANITAANGFIVANACPPDLVTGADLNIKSGQALAVLTQKVFGHINYTWMDECGWNPNIGVGGEGEFAPRGSGCDRAQLSQWGVWFKGSIDF